MQHNRQSTFENFTFIPKSQLLYVTKTISDHSWHSIPHSHPFTEIFFVTQGEGTIEIEHDIFPVKKYDVVIINPSTEHTERAKKDAILEYVVIGVDGVSVGHPDFGSIDYYKFKDYNKQFHQYVHSLLSEMNDKHRNHTQACNYLLELLLILIMRQPNLEMLEKDTVSATSNMFKVKSYIDNNFKLPLSLDDLAATSNLNKYYLAHAFKEQYGDSPIQYLNRKRIEDSRFLLETTNYSIAEIATLVGISSVSYFSQIFKKFIGVTPTQYRKTL